MNANLASPPPVLPAPPGKSGSLDRAQLFVHHGLLAPGIKLFRNLRFRAKTGLIAVAILLPLLGLVVWQLGARHQDAVQGRMDAVRYNVEVAHGILAWAHGQQAAAGLSTADAQQLARRAIAGLRYDDAEYFWINDMQPRMVMHPIQPNLDNTDIGGMRDPNGLYLFREFVDTVRRDGEGFVAYQWPKPGLAEPVDKISFVKGFEPWGWVIGSGVYVDDLRTLALRRIGVSAGIVLAVLLVAGYLLWSFYRVMEGGLAETRRHLLAMREGDLTTSPEPWGTDEPAQLMLDLRSMQEALRHMVQEVRRSSDDIVHSSSEVAAGTLELSNRTEETAANLQETAASMEQINSTVRSTSDNTAESADVARRNASAAEDGERIMRDVVATMDGIHASSGRISEIINTIDSIAFQTNILALNAAVEAARTGEQGRGFAVVATEVRMLAQRTASAADEIKRLIATSVEQVRAGTAIVRTASETIEDIRLSSQRVDQLLGEIAVGAREQSAGVEQIGRAVQELDRMTQENAAMVEQTASATSAMRDQALQLASEVARFRLPERHAMARATEAPRLGLSAAPGPGGAVGAFDVDAAIDAHRQWKVRLRQAIAHQGHLDADTICRDDRCQLGKWLHGAGRQRWGRQAEFSALLERHADFHRTAGEVARSINAGRYPDAERLIGAGSAFARVSTEVTSLLARARHWR